MGQLLSAAQAVYFSLVASKTTTWAVNAAGKR